MNQTLKPSIDKNDFIECEYCKNKLYRKIIEWELYGTKRTIALDYERCECNDAQAYWNEYDLKKLRMLEEEKKLELMQKFSRKVEKIIRNSKMSKRNLSYKFDNYEPNNSNRKVFNNLKKYSERLVNGIEKKGLILIGNNGVGKTHLACSIANKLIENGTPVIYGTLINLLAELRNSYDIDKNISEMEIFKLYENVDLLIIDDLGKEKPSEWGLEKLFTIINSRYENNLPVIITTNYNQKSLMERLSLNGEIETAKSIISRLYEMCYLVKIDDIDHRIKKKKVSNCGNND
ncbi:MAG: ATP-binding protein [Clostridia bacterium]